MILRMCQLFALESNTPTAATFSLTGFAARGGDTGEHVDGWGVAFHDEDDCRVYVEAQRAADSPLAAHFCRHPVRARRIVAHIRKATQGPVDTLNCHPFRRQWLGRDWTFCHNGDLKQFHPRLDGRFVPHGQTDSERAFCWLLQQLDQRLQRSAPAGWRQIAPLLADLAAEAAGHGVFNFLLCDGEAVYAYASSRLHWVERGHPFRRVRLVDRDLEIDLALANRPTDRMAVIATEPLTHDERWVAFEPGELRIFSGGRSIWQTTAMPSVIASSPADMRDRAVSV